jgi:hypothetical protein
MRRFAAHRANTDGPFYVVDGECIACGAPESEAGGLMSHDGSGHCFFKTQPKSSQQVDAAIRALWSSCCGAVRYAGKDQSILTRIAELGECSKCDENVEFTLPKTRSRVTFRYQSDDHSVEPSLRSIVQFISSTRSQSEHCRYTDFKYRKTEASFIFHWYIDCSIKFRVKHLQERRWLVSIEDNDQATIGTAISLDKSLQANHQVTEIKWFADDEVIDCVTGGAVHPY